VSESKKQPESTGSFAFEGLERIIHERSRLSILSSLAAHPEGLIFNDLKGLCALTDGNLSRQIQILQEAGLVEVWKGFHKKRPQTMVRFTPNGKKRFLEYIAVLEDVVSNAIATGKKSASAKAPNFRGLSPA
jgi:DNA-binding MarR family transcriptional regulator